MASRSAGNYVGHGLHIEDQTFPKRAHCHKYVAHVIPIGEYVEEIQYACREQDRIDRYFLIIARTDAASSRNFRRASLIVFSSCPAL
jgi:2-methylisocitrate lyase-like PEP mutase family enzyme